MRIIAGRFKGLKLTAPKGRDTRPTADKVKEALFSMLESLPFDLTGARVLDFFAGSGALALEALSRGAASAVLADRDREALTAVKRNLAAIPEAEALVIRTQWPRGFQSLPGGRPFDLFLLDPPYDQTRLPLVLLAEAAARGLASPGAAAVWEQAPDTLTAWTENDAAPWRVLKTRVWGGQAAAFLQYSPADGHNGPADA